MEYLLAQSYSLFLIGIMISAGIIKQYHLFDDIFTVIFRKVKSKRLVLFLVSFFGGILPIPGRVVISAGILDTIAPDNPKSRSKFGIMDYLSTHTFYLWSPLEKTVILPMAALGITWGAFIGYIWPLIAITFSFIIIYNFFYIKEDDIELIMMEEDFSWSRLILGVGPLLFSIGLIVFGFSGAIVFPMLAAYYIALTSSFKDRNILDYINWQLVFLLFVVLIASVFFGSHQEQLQLWIESNSTIADITTLTGFITISAAAFMASWVLGSSGKYAGIVALLLTIYGPEYLIWFIALEYSAYNLSPTHKCIHIGRMYFNTTVKDYFLVIFLWQLILLITAGILI